MHHVDLVPTCKLRKSLVLFCVGIGVIQPLLNVFKAIREPPLLKISLSVNISTSLENIRSQVKSGWVIVVPFTSNSLNMST